MRFKYNILNLASSKSFPSFSVYPFTALRPFGTQTKRPRFQMDPKILDDLKELQVYPDLRQLFESQIIGPKNGKGNVHANNSIKYIKIIFLDVNNKKCPVGLTNPLQNNIT